MVQCPSCESRRVVIVVSVREPRRAMCVTCGSRWLEREAPREHVERVGRVEVRRIERVSGHPSWR
jgi:transposase-like protein